jgi:nucleotide-binding universal stress UspA family protein
MSIQAVEYITPIATGAIMVPLSVNDEDVDTLLYGAKLADRLKRNLLVVHVVHEPGDKPGLYHQLEPQEMHIPLSDLANNICRRRIEALQSDHPELESLQNPSLYVVPGLPATRIVEIAEKEEVCCIVMVKSKDSAIGRLIHAPVTDSVAEHADCPVVEIGSGDGDKATDPLPLEISHLASQKYAYNTRALQHSV